MQLHLLAIILLFPTTYAQQLAPVLQGLGGACDAATTFLTRSRGLLHCTCDRDSRTVACEFARPRCLGPLCGTTSTLTLGLQQAERCASIYCGVLPMVPPLCLQVTGRSRRWATCGVTIGGAEACDCTVCAGGRSVALECGAGTSWRRGQCVDVSTAANLLQTFVGF